METPIMRDRRIKTTTAKARGLFLAVENGGQGYRHYNTNRPRVYFVESPQGALYEVDVNAQTCTCAQFVSDGECKHRLSMTRRVRFAEKLLSISPTEEKAVYNPTAYTGSNRPTMTVQPSQADQVYSHCGCSPCAPAEEKKERTYHVRRHSPNDPIGSRSSKYGLSVRHAEEKANHWNLIHADLDWCYQVHPDEEEDY